MTALEGFVQSGAIEGNGMAADAGKVPEIDLDMTNDDN
jgi:hypothetical protein